jgi:preprotein translocase subunit SecG
MFYGLLVGIHIFVAVLLIIIILMQASKGGGLSGAFGTGTGSSPLFGAATSTVLVRATTVLAIVFAITCLSIAAIQGKRSRIMQGVKTPKKEQAVHSHEEEETSPSTADGAVGKDEQADTLSPVEAGAPETKEGDSGTQTPPAVEEKPQLSPIEGGNASVQPGDATSPPKPLSPVEGESAPEE